MLAERDLDIVLIATPDHWHALPMIEAVKAGCDVYQQKPISVDVVEGQAMLAAARKYGRVVQVGTQRRSTPHLIEARDQIIRQGKLGKVGLVEIYCYIPMRLNDESARHPRRPITSTGTPGPDPRPCGPTPRQFIPSNGAPTWSIATASWATWASTCSTWRAGCSAWAGPSAFRRRAAFSSRRTRRPTSPTRRRRRSNTTTSPSSGSTARGAIRPTRRYTWGAAFHGDKGTLKASVYRYEFTPLWQTKPTIHKDVTYELEQYPEDKTEERLEKHVAPAIRYHMLDFLAAIAKRSRPVADIEEGFISTSCCILANVALATGRSITWDPARMLATDNEHANRLLRRVYRQGYTHPEPSAV